VIDAASLLAARPAGTKPAIKVAALSPAHADTAHDPAPAVAGRARARAAAVAGHDGPARGHGVATPAAGHAPGHDAHWAYEGENGPQAWAKLKPEFNVCAIGKRQSPIHIEDTAALPGPAEPLQLAYRASGGSVVNNGHTIQVDLEGDNTLTVRGTPYRLVQFHFHHPAEEKVNHKGFAMVAHLVHKSDDGKLAVVAVLMDPGAPSPLIEKVWTHMPLDTADRVKLPAGLIDVNELLPKDQRYYQFIGSLTTPPCTEGVLWLVLKQPMTLARDQLRLFAQQFPNNARPVQALNGRTIREAQ
jgi:carbonic anhydrase